MRLLLRLLVFLLATGPLFGANRSLLHARQAQALLGPAVWSDVIRIENDNPRGRYPRALHALVFELAGMLWFYTSSEGTQGFSLHRGRVEQEKADYGPLLRDLEPGFTRWATVTGGPMTPDFDAPLPNGCFIESVAAWRRRGRGDFGAHHPQLLSYYLETGGRRRGHTVLTYWSPRGLVVFDPADPRQRDPLRFAAIADATALAVARSLEPRATKAHLIPIEVPAVPASHELVASRDRRDEDTRGLRPVTALR